MVHEKLPSFAGPWPLIPGPLKKLGPGPYIFAALIARTASLIIWLV